MKDHIVCSEKLEAALVALADEGGVVDYGKADATIEAGQEGEEDLFDSGFDLAMKLVRMSALSKYTGASLKVFRAHVEVDGVTVFMVGASEEEVLARAQGFRRIG